MKNIEKYISIAMLLFAVGFNLWLYRMEPTAQVDPNDNTFQFALVYRTNQIWDFASQKCSSASWRIPVCFFSYLADHWVPNWNEGYNLPFYYSHVPQIVIVGAWRMLHAGSLFQFYHVIIYLLLCLFPLSVFLALRVTGVSWFTAGFGALLASHMSTDGLYGLDPPSFLWRGYGLSSQLFAMVWLPLALAYCWRALGNKRAIIPAILFLILTTAGHLGMGMMAFLALIPLALARPSKKTFITLGSIAVVAIGFLSYWILPAMTLDRYHNFSFWDPVWKFNSYGGKEVILRLFNGALFDFGRLPIITGLILIGLFVGYSEFTLLFIFFLLMYFGRTTWGNLFNIIPGMKEFHLSRFLVGVHAAGFFLAPIGLTWIASRVSKRFTIHYSIVTILLFILIIAFVYPQTVRYAAYNDTLIAQANGNYAKQATGANSLVSTLQALQKTASGRIYTGRGGGWGKDFKIAETSMTMYLGNFALPTVLWMPETWSPNADTEQYFREDKVEDYDLYNIRYVAAPANLAKTNIQPFWKLIEENPSWKIYEVNGLAPRSLGEVGYFTAGVRPAVVAADKYSRTNVVRLWIQSSDPKNGLYPELSFDTKKYPVNVGLPNFKMLDEVTFITPDGKTHNLFSELPKYISPISPIPPISLTSQTDNSDMIFTAHATVPEGCTECMVILKQTYHPNWRVTVDGKPVTPIIVFPFFIGIPVTAGDHTIIASYEPSKLKIILLSLSLTTLTALIMLFLVRKLGIDKKATNIPH